MAVGNGDHFVSECVEAVQSNAALRAAQDWLLPTAMLFVSFYRTRRVWKRIVKEIGHSTTSAIPGPKLLRYSRELQAGKAILVLLTFCVLLLPVRYAYVSDHDDYLRRVHGYYLMIRGTALHCDATGVAQKCLPADGVKKQSRSDVTDASG
jgi:hypothetical protein